MSLVFRNRYELEYEIDDKNVLDYQYELNGKSESDGLTAPISSSYLLILVAFIAMAFAFYVFCIAEKQFQRQNCLTPNEKSKFSEAECHQKQISSIDEKQKLSNHSKIDVEIV